MPKRKAAARDLFEQHPNAFANEDMAIHFMRQVFTSRSHQWAFAGNGKSGTSSMFRFLFRMEFGNELSVDFDDPVDINSDSIIHRTKEHGVFRSLFLQSTRLERIPAENRFTLVRHPVARATSAFSYFCESNRRASAWMLKDRVWINALCGFDWQQDPMTETGFIKFLEYIGLLLEQGHPQLVNPHWIPQHLNFVPEVYRPGLIGRLEEFDLFVQQVAERLDYPLPERSGDSKRRNVQPQGERDGLASAPETLARIQKLYAGDFEFYDSLLQD